MAYRTLRQGAADASMPEDRAGYEDYMDTPEGRAKANALALLMGGAGSLAYKGASMLPSVGSGSLRQWLATTGARTAAPEAVLMEPAAGVAARNAITQGSVMSPKTAGATLLASAPIVMAPSPNASEPFDTWGRKVAGPSASTSSMDSPTDDHVMQPAPIPTPVRDLVARAQSVAARQAPSASPAAAAPAQGGNFFSNMFKNGPAVQSNNQALTRYDAPSSSEMGPGRGTVHVNWGDRDNAADFFRADKAMREAQSAGQDVTGLKRGGAAQAPGKDAALHKALEIIHHLLTRGH